jgi:hypothetical protein
VHRGQLASLLLSVPPLPATVATIASLLRSVASEVLDLQEMYVSFRQQHGAVRHELCCPESRALCLLADFGRRCRVRYSHSDTCSG